jgi:hypothetical protein
MRFLLCTLRLNSPLNPPVWALFMKMMHAFHTYAFDYLGEMLVRTLLGDPWLLLCVLRC